MAAIKWDAKYETGVRKIDRQHRKIVDILNELYEMQSSEAAAADIQRIFDRLRAYIQEHFDTEEAYLAEHSGGELDTQEHEHESGYDEGASEAEAGECDPVERVRELTLGEGARVGFEASGNKGAQEMLLGATHFEGRIVYAAIAPPGKVIDPSGRRQGAFLGNRAVHGTFTFSMGAYFDMVRALLLHDLHPGKLITHRFSIDDAGEAYRVTDSGDCGKVIFQWDE